MLDDHGGGHETVTVLVQELTDDDEKKDSTDGDVGDDEDGDEVALLLVLLFVWDVKGVGGSGDLLEGLVGGDLVGDVDVGKDRSHHVEVLLVVVDGHHPQWIVGIDLEHGEVEVIARDPSGVVGVVVVSTAREEDLSSLPVGQVDVLSSSVQVAQSRDEGASEGGGEVEVAIVAERVRVIGGVVVSVSLAGGDVEEGAADRKEVISPSDIDIIDLDVELNVDRVVVHDHGVPVESLSGLKRNSIREGQDHRSELGRSGHDHVDRTPLRAEEVVLVLGGVLGVVVEVEVLVEDVAILVSQEELDGDQSDAASSIEARWDLGPFDHFPVSRELGHHVGHRRERSISLGVRRCVHVSATNIDVCGVRSDDKEAYKCGQEGSA